METEVKAPQTAASTQGWTQRAYRNLVYFNEVDKGGTSEPGEQPRLFCEELRAAFRSLRGSH